MAACASAHTAKAIKHLHGRISDQERLRVTVFHHDAFDVRVRSVCVCAFSNASHTSPRGRVERRCMHSLWPVV